MPHRPPSPEDHDAGAARRETRSVEIVADALLTLLIKERRQELDALDAELRVAKNEVVNELEQTELRTARRRSPAAEASLAVACPLRTSRGLRMILGHAGA